MGARLIEGVQESHTNLQFVLAYYGGRHAADLFDRKLTNEKSHIESHRVFCCLRDLPLHPMPSLL